MYEEGKFRGWYLQLANPDDTQHHRAAVGMLTLLAKAFFVEHKDWSNKPPLVPFELNGRVYNALDVQLRVARGTLRGLVNFEYSQFEFFVLKPDDPVNQPAPIAYRVTNMQGQQFKDVADLRLLATHMLRQIEGHILVKHPPYATLHRELRREVEATADDFWAQMP